MTLAALVIFIAEYFAMRALDQKYLREGEERLDLLEFRTRASFDDVLRMHHHVVNSWLAMGFLTIGSIVKL